MRLEAHFQQGHTVVVWQGKPGHGAPGEAELLAKVSLNPRVIQRVELIDDGGEVIRCLWDHLWHPE
jgi:hypothetical protein